MKEDNKNKINRRDFFKLAGAGTLASAAALYGCSGNKNNGESESAALGEIPTGKMTYRTNPTRATGFLCWDTDACDGPPGNAPMGMETK